MVRSKFSETLIERSPPGMCRVRSRPVRFVFTQAAATAQDEEPDARV